MMRKGLFTLIALAIVLGAAAPAFAQPGVGPGQNRTPITRSAFVILPFYWDLGDRPEAERALLNQGYLVWKFEQTSPPDLTPDFRIPSYLTKIGGDYGGGLYNAHGACDGHSVTPYPHTSAGLNAAFAEADLQNQTYPGLCWVGETSQSYTVSVYYYVAFGYSRFAEGAIFHNQCCHGGCAGGWLGTAVWYAPPGSCSYQESQQNVTYLWGGMDGDYGWEKRSSGRAYVDAPNLNQYETIVDGRKSTLAPSVKWTDSTPHQMIPAGGLTVEVLFDTHCESSVSPTTIWRADGGVFTIDSGTWQGDTLLTARINPVDNVYATGTLVAQQQFVYSMDCDNLHLDGDAQGGASDWTIPLKHDNGPAAVILGVDCKDGMFMYEVESEDDQTAGYRVEGNNPPDDAWYSVGDLQPPGTGKRSCPVNGFSHYRIVEVTKDGHEKIGAIARVGSNIAAIPIIEERSYEQLRVDFHEMLQRAPEGGGGSPLLNGEKIVVFCPTAWQSDMEYLLGYLAGWYGITYQIYTIEQYGAPENRYNGIKSRINTMYGQGYRYVLLVGDASDWQYFDGPFTAEYWPTAYWETVRQSYFGAGYPHGGDPSLNIIPIKMVKDQLPREQGVAFYQPYYQLSDMLSYGDVDQDSLPDLAVGRWAVNTQQEVTQKCYKTLEYITQGGWGYDQPYNVTIYLGDVNHNEGGEGTHAVAVWNAIKSHLHPATQYHELRESQYPDTDDRLAAAVNIWNVYQSDLVAFISTGSGRYDPGAFFHQSAGFNENMISYGHPAVVFGGSCGTSNEYMTQAPGANYGKDVDHRMCVADGRGAEIWFGPTAGTTQEGNRIVGEEFVTYVQQSPGRAVCESARLALRDAMLATSAPEDWDLRTVVKSYQFHGFPLSPLNHRNYVVGVEDQVGAPHLQLALAPMAPNPVSKEGGIIAFTLPARGSVALRLFDVGGRVVQHITSQVQDAGQHIMQWTPDAKIACGHYYLKLHTDSGTITRSVTVLR